MIDRVNILVRLDGSGRRSIRGTRRFCPRCGTQVTFEHEDFSDEIDLTTCSLDDPNSRPPKDHIHTSSKLEWIILADGLPEYCHDGARR
jgi:hypothetical protein